jgi:poly-gamma-glutamate synthesis protein (capsule biosynthesis protein)
MVESAGIVCGGIGENPDEAEQIKIMERNGLRVGFLCYLEDGNWTLGFDTPGPAYYEFEKVKKQVRENREKVDILIVSIHGDLEFMDTPSLPRLNQSRELIRAGADLLLEHHPHVPQGMEKIGNGWIVYSLGNFVWAVDTDDYLKPSSPRCFDSFIFTAEFSEKGVENVDRIPTRIAGTPEHRPYILDGEESRALMDSYKELDAMLADTERVAKNWSDISHKHL